WTPLTSAIADGRFDIVQELVEGLSHDVNYKSSGGWTPLGTALWKMKNYTCVDSINTDIIKYLLENGADPNEIIIKYYKYDPDHTWEESTIKKPIKLCRYDIVALLLKHGFDLERLDEKHCKSIAMIFRANKCSNQLIKDKINPYVEWANEEKMRIRNEHVENLNDINDNRCNFLSLRIIQLFILTMI